MNLQALLSANPLDNHPFSDYEKRLMIAEAIKSSTIPLPELMHMLDEWNVTPQWDKVPLPPGRSLISCRQVFEELTRPRLMNIQGSYKRSIGDLSDPAIESPRKRFQIGPDPAPRSLQPKPAAKRRGRPTNAQRQARAYEAVQRGEMLPSGTAGHILGSPSYGDVPGAGSFVIGPMSMPDKSSTPSPHTGDDERRKRGRLHTSKPKVKLTPEQSPTALKLVGALPTAHSLTPIYQNKNRGHGNTSIISRNKTDMTRDLSSDRNSLETSNPLPQAYNKYTISEDYTVGEGMIRLQRLRSFKDLRRFAEMHTA
ncbi:hypothetical protein F5884DRAFT_857337 [Xylogone sp. PMI_703]|nr:hypothetical protein F5884DRAFT_857337 [Xylogone sp. PMI_703]